MDINIVTGFSLLDIHLVLAFSTWISSLSLGSPICISTLSKRSLPGYPPCPRVLLPGYQPCPRVLLIGYHPYLRVLLPGYPPCSKGSHTWISTLSQGTVLSTASSAPSISRIRRFTVGFPAACSTVHKHIVAVQYKNIFSVQYIII